MRVVEFVVTAEEAGERLDVAVARHTELSRTIASRLEVTVDGKPAPKSLRLEAGQSVAAPIPDDAPPPEAERIDVPIVFEDDAIIVVSKPAGLVVHPAPGHPAGTLVNALLARAGRPAGGDDLDRPGIVHRLDAGTSGLMVVAKREDVHATLVEMIAARHVKRVYLALVQGVPASPGATIDAPIGRSSRHRKKMAVVAEGREAITHYRTLEELGGVALLEVTLETGRTHQIRVHLAEIGHPVTGDPAYGRSKKSAERLGLERPFLHAARLAFAHPVSGEALDFEVPLPPDLAQALELARATR